MRRRAPTPCRVRGQPRHVRIRSAPARMTAPLKPTSVPCATSPDAEGRVLPPRRPRPACRTLSPNYSRPSRRSAVSTRRTIVDGVLCCWADASRDRPSWLPADAQCRAEPRTSCHSRAWSIFSSQRCGKVIRAFGQAVQSLNEASKAPSAGESGRHRCADVAPASVPHTPLGADRI
jgi:hypothetical protein